MKISINWLKQYVPINIPPTELADKLTMAGLEVEGITEKFQYLDSVVVGKIIEVHPHPNADKLSLCKVSIGEQTITVVCGAPNAKAGMKIPCALPGAVLSGGLAVKKNTIRGESSEGMLCSESDLELGLDKSGLMVLSEELTEGVSINTALNLSDTAFEIGLTPNRPDCLSFIGIAREVATMVNQPIKLPEINLPQTSGRIDDFTSVTIENPELCPRYAARLITDITVAPSPFWLQDRLLSIGLKPVNNIVDITNFVMMELGQPLHAFDFDRLAENRIVVRTARDKEVFTTLDDKERRLTENTLMICDGERPVAVAGVMGGVNSEIEENTTRVLLESAYFNPISIRKTAKHLTLNSDASHRFERGVDPEGTVVALNRAAQLIAEIGNGNLIGGVIDEHPSPPFAKSISLSVTKTNKHLGTDLNQPEIAAYLKSVEFNVKITDEDTLAVLPPTFRVDVSRPEDLMEEVARLWGYNNIKTTFPKISGVTNLPNQSIEIKNQIIDMMAGYGFSESISYSFIGKDACDRLRLPENDERRRMLDILNPISEDMAVMRTSLIPGLLETMHRNLSHQIKNLKIFELGKIFISNGQAQQPTETEMLAGLWTGTRFNMTWHSKPVSCDFYDLKGVLEDFFHYFGMDRVSFSKMGDELCSYTKAGHTAQILLDGNPFGLIGEIDATVLNNFNIKQPAFIFELNINTFISNLPETKMFVPIPKFPFTDRDITLIVDNHVQAGDIIEKVKFFEEKLMEDICVLDVYSGKPIPAGKKSISLRIIYRSFTETLSDQHVNLVHQQLTDRIIQKFNATLPV
ncbi:MAG: phenylalanine--tRNA ligase subunit beta [Desulfobacteraceae bacterium]|nr:phenylalanine--tRNA ligase subunit beta [Desulfobacteraceae bacterium]MBC2754438.1 phenylalanine--tRNA ligase subunit beta [Desulfobacteraceae bacterium]